MKHLHLGAIALCVGLLLSACGGGGGDRGSSLDVGGAESEAQLTPAQAREQFAEIGQTANRLDMTEMRVWYAPPSASTTAYGECSSAVRCTAATDEFSLIFTPENLSAIPRNAEIQGRGSRQGVPVVEYSGTSNAVLEFGSLNRPASVDYRTLGGWMDYHFFTINLWEFERVGWQLWNAASVGVESGSNPVSGSATWTGAMVGRLSGGPGVQHERPGVLLLGDSRLIFDFATNELDVALTRIQSDDGTSYADLTWDNLPAMNGAFAGRGVSGRFYGPNHEEVGGLFSRDDLMGAFGATRQ